LNDSLTSLEGKYSQQLQQNNATFSWEHFILILHKRTF
jgi:hypothetical protein